MGDAPLSLLASPSPSHSLALPPLQLGGVSPKGESYPPNPRPDLPHLSNK